MDKESTQNLTIAPSQIKTYVNFIILKTLLHNLYLILPFVLPINGQNGFAFLLDLFRGQYDLLELEIFERVVLLVLSIFILIYTMMKIFLTKDKYHIYAQQEPTDSAAYRFWANHMLSGIACGLNLLVYAAPYIMEQQLFGQINGKGEKSCVILMIAYGLLVFFPALCFRKHQKLFSRYFFSTGKRRTKNHNDQKAATYSGQNDNIEALLQYKKLYDSGAITQEEYEAKKEELMK